MNDLEITKKPKSNATVSGRKSKRKRFQRVGVDNRSNLLKQGLVRTSYWRLGVQIFFALTCVYLGIKFYLFVKQVGESGSSTIPRPSGVEGFLPISGLMGVIDWIYQGTLNSIHPAATMLFLTFILLSLLIRKSFCGWICPVGFLSETLGRVGQFLFKRNYLLPRWLDIPLRGIKYFLLGFFLWAILGMSPESLHTFIQSPYNRISDVKMMYFFLDISRVSLNVILVLAGLSVFVHSFWCRYLCPYGALLGLFSWLSAVKIRRDPKTCIDCGICDKVCPARLPVSKELAISNVECIGCVDCVASCPVSEALRCGTRKRTFSYGTIAISVLILFFLGFAIASISGTWESDLTNREIQHHIERMNDTEYTHPGR